MPLFSCSDIESPLRTLSARRDVKQDEALRQIKPVWIRNLGDAQQDDGGWSPFAALVPVGGGCYFGYVQKFFTIKQPSSSFHMTDSRRRGKLRA